VIGLELPEQIRAAYAKRHTDISRDAPAAAPVLADLLIRRSGTQRVSNEPDPGERSDLADVTARTIPQVKYDHGGHREPDTRTILLEMNCKFHAS
jgi:hypothetical protein